VVRAAIVVPVILLVIFAGVFGLLGLLCGRERRKYVMNLSLRAMSTAGLLIHGPAIVSPQRRPASRRWLGRFQVAPHGRLESDPPHFAGCP
jgi:hypothetical protein